MVDTLTDRFILCRTIAVELLPTLRQSATNNLTNTSIALDTSFNNSSLAYGNHGISNNGGTSFSTPSSSLPLVAIVPPTVNEPLRSTIHTTAHILQQAVNLSIENEQTTKYQTNNNSQSALALVASLLNNDESSSFSSSPHPPFTGPSSSSSSSSSTITMDRQIIHKSIACFLDLTEPVITDVETLRNWLAALLLQRLSTNVSSLCSYLSIHNQPPNRLTMWLENTDTLFFSLDIRGTGSLNLQEFVWFTLAIAIHSREQYQSHISFYPYLYTNELWTNPSYFLAIVALWMNTIITDTGALSSSSAAKTTNAVKPILREGESLLLQRLGYISLPLWRTWLATQQGSEANETVPSMQYFRDYIERCGAALGIMDTNNKNDTISDDISNTVFDLHKSWYRSSTNGVHNAAQIYASSFAGTYSVEQNTLLEEACTLLIACINSIGASALLSIAREGRAILDSVSSITSSVVAILTHIPSSTADRNLLSTATINNGSVVSKASIISLACSLAPNAVHDTVHEYMHALQAQLPQALNILTNEYKVFEQSTPSPHRSPTLPPFLTQSFLSIVQKVYQERYQRKHISAYGSNHQSNVNPINTLSTSNNKVSSVTPSSTIPPPNRIPIPVVPVEIPITRNENNSNSSSNQHIPYSLSPTKSIMDPSVSTSAGTMQVWSPKLRSPLKQLIVSAANEKTIHTNEGSFVALNNSVVNSPGSIKLVNKLPSPTVSPVIHAVQSILTTTMLNEQENRALASSGKKQRSSSASKSAPLGLTTKSPNLSVVQTTEPNGNTNAVPTFSISLDELFEEPPLTTTSYLATNNPPNNNDNIDTVQVSLSFDDETITSYNDANKSVPDTLMDNNSDDDEDEDNQSVPPPPPSPPKTESIPMNDENTTFSTSDSDESSVLEFQPLRMSSLSSSLSNVSFQPLSNVVNTQTFPFTILPPPPPPPTTQRKKKVSLGNTITAPNNTNVNSTPVTTSSFNTSMLSTSTTTNTTTPVIPVHYANEYSQLQTQLHECLDNLLEPSLQLEQRDNILHLMRQIRQRLRLLEIPTNNNPPSYTVPASSTVKSIDKLFTTTSPSVPLPSTAPTNEYMGENDNNNNNRHRNGSSPTVYAAEPLIFPVNLQAISPTDSVRSSTLETLPGKLEVSTRSLSRPSVDRYFPTSPDLAVAAIHAANAATTAANAVMKATEDLRKANFFDVINTGNDVSHPSQGTTGTMMMMNIDDEVENAQARPLPPPSASSRNRTTIVSDRSSSSRSQSHSRNSVQWNDNTTIHNYTLTTAMDATLSRSRAGSNENDKNNNIIKIIHEKGIAFDGTLPLLRGNNLQNNTLPTPKTKPVGGGGGTSKDIVPKRSESVTRPRTSLGSNSTATPTINNKLQSGSKGTDTIHHRSTSGTRSSRATTPLVRRLEPTTYANKASARKSIGAPVLQTMLRANQHDKSTVNHEPLVMESFDPGRKSKEDTHDHHHSRITQKNTVTNNNGLVSHGIMRTTGRGKGMQSPTTDVLHSLPIIPVPSTILANDQVLKVPPVTTVTPVPTLVPPPPPPKQLLLYSTDEPSEEDDNVSMIHTVQDDYEPSVFITPTYNASIPTNFVSNPSPLLLVENNNMNNHVPNEINNNNDNYSNNNDRNPSTVVAPSVVAPTFSWPSLPLDQMINSEISPSLNSNGNNAFRTPLPLFLRTPIASSSLDHHRFVNNNNNNNNNISTTKYGKMVNGTTPSFRPSSKPSSVTNNGNTVIHPRLRKFQLADGHVFGTSPPQLREKNSTVEGGPKGDGAGSITIILPSNTTNNSTTTQPSGNVTNRKSISKSTISRLHAGLSIHRKK